MHCFKCGATLPPEAAACPACGASTLYNVTASTPETFNVRPDPAVPGNTGEEQAPPPVVSGEGETPHIERTILPQPPHRETAESKNVEHTVLQQPSPPDTPTPPIERTVLQQPPQPAPPSSSPAWQQPQPMQGQQPFPGQQPPQQAPWH